MHFPAVTPSGPIIFDFGPTTAPQQPEASAQKPAPTRNRGEFAKQVVQQHPDIIANRIKIDIEVNYKQLSLAMNGMDKPKVRLVVNKA